MPGLSFNNKLISHDRGLHCNFVCLLLLYSKQINHFTANVAEWLN